VVPATDAVPKNAAAKISASTEEDAMNSTFFSSTTIYPNPVRENSFNVFISGLKNNEQASVTILDINGKPVFNTRLSQSGKITHSLGTGVYFVRIVASGINVTKKLVIE
jgi:hypothetical protein